MSPRLRRHAVQCLVCLDVVESRHRRDFVACSCGAVFVDGGTECPRTGGNPGTVGPAPFDLYTLDEGDLP